MAPAASYILSGVNASDLGLKLCDSYAEEGCCVRRMSSICQIEYYGRSSLVSHVEIIIQCCNMNVVPKCVQRNECVDSMCLQVDLESRRKLNMENASMFPPITV